MRYSAFFCVAAVMAMTTAVSISAAEPVTTPAPATVGATAFADISTAELTKAIAAKQVTPIDCNGSDSFAGGHIPGAIDFATHGKDLAAHLPKDKAALVVAYCGGPYCSAYKAGAQAAQALGYTNVRHYSAGISGWIEAGAAVAK
jgi:rhodanese-related sulfurtransferase